MGHIAKDIIADGGTVTFVIWDDQQGHYSQKIIKDVHVVTIRVPKKRWFPDLVRQHIVFAREFRQLIRKLKPDIVHTNFAVPSIVARWIAAKEGTPLVISTQHELYGSMSPHLRWGLRLTEKCCSAVVYVSYAVARSFGANVAEQQSERAASHPRHVVIPNGIDIETIRNIVADVSVRVPGRMVCAGRMVPDKGQMELVDALPEVLRRHPHVHLHLVGSGPMEGLLRQRVDELGLMNRVEFLGWQPHDEVLREMARAEVVIVPSKQEGFGLVIAEALTCGTPVIASDIEVLREVLANSEGDCRFFTPIEPSALAKVIIDFPFNAAGTEPARAPKPVDALMNFSSRRMVEDYLHVYEKLNTG